jgi:general stress protein 26
MKRLSKTLIHFLQKQGCVVVTTVSAGGLLHSSCKGIVSIDPRGHVYLFDLYLAKTFANLKHDNRISITAVDEHSFIGYTLSGAGRIVEKDAVAPHILKAWEDKITERLTTRVVRNLQEKKGHPRHPEILMPRPQYLIILDVEEIVDLRPRHLR